MIYQQKWGRGETDKDNKPLGRWRGRRRRRKKRRRLPALERAECGSMLLSHWVKDTPGFKREK